jgi:urease accessory protein
MPATALAERRCGRQAALARAITVGAGTAALLTARAASAHTGTGLAGGFGAGFRHPLTGWDHLLAMVSVGLWGAFLGRPLIYALPVTFPAMMVAGAIIGMLAVPVGCVEVGIALSVVALGSCIALSLRAPVWSACIVVGTFAVFHGYAHGRELPSAADPIGYSVGFVLATGLLHVGGIAIGLLNELPGGTLVTRTLGALVAIFGVLLPPTLLSAALGLALIFAPRRQWAPLILALAATACATAMMPLPGVWLDGLFMGNWASVALTAAMVHLPRVVGFGTRLVLSLNAGFWCGEMVALTGSLTDLAMALTAVLVVLPGAWMLDRRAAMLLKMASSWLIAVAILAATLQLLPVTPGYLPDHTE